ncbi:MAG: hypothetical protein KJO06_08255 [Gemmatimonadetes bacterium]|nr:hypothetical protein [Gemmatimonadota bacterium]NNK49405.1 hypothetical protein [Gemmatimonadota bacterium]
MHARITRFLLGGLLAFALLWAATGPGTAIAQEGEYGVYLKLVENAPGGFDQVVTTLREGAEAAGWTVVADYEVGVPDKNCSYRAHGIAVVSDEYVDQVLSHGPRAAFALPLRLGVFEDEAGVHVAAFNPLSLNRTIISETEFAEGSASAVAALQEIVAPFEEFQVESQYGQMRDEGLIKKTMGLIAGGAFDGKIEEAASVDVDEYGGLLATAEQLYSGLEDAAGDYDWKMRPMYLLDLSDQGVVMIGMTSGAMEAKAFDIVKEGTDEAREDFACPGLAYAAAFPLELVLVEEDGEVRVLLIDAMFRMKMFFEDAGKMKFAANMKMPPSLEGEMRDKIEDSLY